jgi:hypothetical protein
MGDADKNNLFPEINPNIDQIIQDEKMIDSDNAVKNEIIEVDKKDQDDIFETFEKSLAKEATKGDKTPPAVKPISQKKKEHLDNARVKSAETRRQKAEERKRLKEEEKARKEEEKKLRREATAERNRQKARERYYKQKEQKDKQKEEVKEIPKQIVKDTTPKVRNIIQEAKNPNNMDFNTFAKYMMRYETLKEQYNKEIEEKNNKTKEEKKKEESKSYHPHNYPLRNYYHKDRMKTFTNF